MKLLVTTMVRNEEKIIPYFIHHYKDIADLILMVDHESTDNTVKIAKETADKLKVKLDVISLKNEGYDDTLLKNAKEGLYKNFRSQFDVVIIADADEFWHNKDGTRLMIQEYWNIKKDNLVIKPFGYQMIHDSFPVYEDKPMIELIRKGSEDKGFDKPLCFSTSLDLHGMMGMHVAYHYDQKGRVVNPMLTDFKLLHYKFLGLEHRIERVKNSANNLSQHGKDLLAKGIAIQFECNETNLTNEFEHWKTKAVDVDI